MKQTFELYPEDAVARLRRGSLFWTALTWAVALATLVVCIVLTAGVTELNAKTLQWKVCTVSCLGGWVVIFLHSVFARQRRRELAHVRMLAHEPRETLRGTVTLEPMRFSIPRSITVQKLRVETGESVRRVNLQVRYVRKLPKLPAPMTLTVSHGYVVEWEAV